MNTNVAIQYLMRESKRFTSVEREDLCEDCRKENNDDNYYSPFAEEAGVCSRCGVETDLVNKCITELLLNNHIDIEDYYQCEGPRIYQSI
ncbi:hypothetical protein [Elizabethkingia anophelis]|uniref:hypothetical protein n=1 Tax=Elizabethkingia anophelis TaxID=1117645 RepID=UPI000994FA17|nr:hypothetical protein [Elizabethkingia anophelis]AQW92948.1 hypothetical protein BBD30_01445 [Elizabethkingia anophelis]MDV3917706.1 hypothetical protein [Elizabethkingia anophelis]MDV4095649.1 hypothetical protein [Elizabethkingia anophelis]OPB61440.1 hypothetical protein BAS07_16815 [Elizabethkingia anophelis]HAY3591741.1 hypothetical protein [Elizabethkingia anophelis]